jgi:hypothetical protein
MIDSAETRSAVPNEIEPGTPASTPAATADRSSAARILARSFYKELRASGYTPRQLVALSTELIGLIALDMQREREDVRRAA